MPRGGHRLELPEVGFDAEELRIVLRQAFYRQRGDFPRRLDVPGRETKMQNLRIKAMPIVAIRTGNEPQGRGRTSALADPDTSDLGREADSRGP
jgi:hypothetical protein